MRNIPYPMNIGGRPYHSWPSFIPVAYELTILFAAGAAFFGMLILNGFPKPYHSIFNTPNFERATLDKFFLCIEARDPKFDVEATGQFLRGLGADVVSEVEPLTMATNTPRTQTGMRRISLPSAAALLGGILLAGPRTDRLPYRHVGAAESEAARGERHLPGRSELAAPGAAHRGPQFLKTDEEYNTGWTGGRLVLDPATGQDQITGAQIVSKKFRPRR